MIVAILLADKPESESTGYFETAHDTTVIESVTGSVLRGPFGGTLVAAHPEVSAEVQDALAGFAVQLVDVPANTVTQTTPHTVLVAALKAADKFRARWAKAMAAAAGRFESTGGPARDSGASSSKGGSSEWSKLKQSSDVKIRGLARSFDRDGVMIIPGDCATIKKEHLAQMVETFAREGQQPNAKNFAQAIAAGVRGWPVIMSLEGAREVAALPATSDFSGWLLKNVEKVSDVKLI